MVRLGSSRTSNNDNKTALTYEEAIVDENVASRGCNLVPHLANILARRGAAFSQKTTNSQWHDAETELGFALPPDYKLLCNTIGTGGAWGSVGAVGLAKPTEIVQNMRNILENYASWQNDNVDDSGAERVGIYPGQAGHHVGWSIDLHGNAMSYFWIVNCSNASQWPTVLLDLEAPLRHNSQIYPATVTELLYRQVTNKHGPVGSLLDDDDDDEDEDKDEDDDDQGGDMTTASVTVEGRKVFQFDSSAQAGSPQDHEGSPQDNQDMAILDSEPDLSPIDFDDCSARKPIVL